MVFCCGGTPYTYDSPPPSETVFKPRSPPESPEDEESEPPDETESPPESTETPAPPLTNFEPDKVTSVKGADVDGDDDEDIVATYTDSKAKVGSRPPHPTSSRLTCLHI